MGPKEKKKNKADEDGDSELPTLMMPELGNAGTAGFRTTTVRLQNEQFDIVEMFCKGLDESMTEFVRIACEERVARLALDPKVRQAVDRQVNRFQRMLDKIVEQGSQGRVPNDG
jgi:hypothetical protein